MNAIGWASVVMPAGHDVLIVTLFEEMEPELIAVICILKRSFPPKWQFCHHPRLVSNLCELFFQLLNTKKDILKNICNQSVDGRHWVGKKQYWSQWLRSTVWLPTFFKISSFVFSRKIYFRNRKRKFRFGTTWGWVDGFWVNDHD